MMIIIKYVERRIPDRKVPQQSIPSFHDAQVSASPR